MTKFFVDNSGHLLGGFDDATQPSDVNGIEVPFPPEHPADTWTGTGYDKSARPVEPKQLTAEALAAVLTAKGLLTGADIEAAKK